ncbi:hypothetical protein E4P39_20595 [Blastococcus sp. CT_GayMR19]|nr:hypothetical protein E4P39_20595 [Blastococcus sp. CT_GayMR19]
MPHSGASATGRWRGPPQPLRRWPPPRPPQPRWPRWPPRLPAPPRRCRRTGRRRVPLRPHSAPGPRRRRRRPLRPRRPWAPRRGRRPPPSWTAGSPPHPAPAGLNTAPRGRAGRPGAG